MSRILIIILILSNLLIIGCNYTPDYKIELQNECIRLGYNNLTDTNFEVRFDGVLVGKIECDGQVYWNNCYNRDYGEFDKWGKYHRQGNTWECND